MSPPNPRQTHADLTQSDLHAMTTPSHRADSARLIHNYTGHLDPRGRLDATLPGGRRFVDSCHRSGVNVPRLTADKSLCRPQPAPAPRLTPVRSPAQCRAPVQRNAAVGIKGTDAANRRRRRGERRHGGQHSHDAGENQHRRHRLGRAGDEAADATVWTRTTGRRQRWRQLNGRRGGGSAALCASAVPRPQPLPVGRSRSPVTRRSPTNYRNSPPLSRGRHGGPAGRRAACSEKLARLASLG